MRLNILSKIGAISALTIISAGAWADTMCMKVDLDSVGYVSLHKARVESIARGSRSPDYAIYLVINGFGPESTTGISKVVLMSNAAEHGAAPVCKKQKGENNSKNVICVASLPRDKMIVIVTYGEAVDHGMEIFPGETKIIVRDVDENVLNCDSK